MATTKATTTKAITAEARGLRLTVEATEMDGSWVMEETVAIQFIDEDGHLDGERILFPTADLERAAALLGRVRDEQLRDYRSSLCVDHGVYTPVRVGSEYRCPECCPAPVKVQAVPDAAPANLEF